MLRDDDVILSLYKALKICYSDADNIKVYEIHRYKGEYMIGAEHDQHKRWLVFLAKIGENPLTWKIMECGNRLPLSRVGSYAL